jgi:hypothetical protein
MALLCLSGAGGLLGWFCFSGYFAATYFAQDDYVWLCFAKFDSDPQRLLIRDSLAGQFFRPVGQYWWIAVHALAGYRVAAYQWVYLTVHLVNAVLAGILAGRLGDRRMAQSVTILFALNPVFIAPVSNYLLYIFDTLGFTWYLTALLLVLHACGHRSTFAGCLSLVAALLACFSKESYFTIPAAVAAVVIVSRSQHLANAGRRSCMGWVAGHALVASGAWIWRSCIIDGFGGYGVAQISTPLDAGLHLFERARTLLGFAGWSLAPMLSRWQGTEFFPLVGSAALLIWLTLTGWKLEGVGSKWCWGWILVNDATCEQSRHALVDWYRPRCGDRGVLCLAWLDVLLRSRSRHRCSASAGCRHPIPLPIGLHSRVSRDGSCAD